MTPLVLLPGLACDEGLWAPQLTALSGPADMRVADTLQDDSLPAMAARVLADAPDRFALAGLSMGGYLAFEIMRQAPERVQKLALLDTSARPDTPEQAEKRADTVAALDRIGMGGVMQAGLDTLLAAGASSELRRAVVAMGERVGADAYRRQQRAIAARPDSRPMLFQIAVPTLVLVGEEDALTPPAVAREMADAIPHATLVQVPGSGHLSTLERPDAVTAAMRDWLAR
ncbi:alpha/beta fold hydrolase [Sphingomonas lenta]|uniref:Alpha/beta hydrolase n=1 Tax=Sphingomonas lenta TaxID=1141887 RepID=A0A2A2SF00_9SPHN|nr:alpha/beta fold hydrolase [Sphingomonas lenta]PAX07785.1 alpha/beta hydrolase [Sphingomonas lenta]